MKPIDNQHGVSETLGSMLLISVIATAIAIIAVGIFSQPRPEKIPAVSMEIKNMNNEILITHAGGDQLPKSETRIIVDGNDLTSSFSMLNGAPWTDWLVGDTLVYTVPANQAMPDSVQVQYVGKSSARVLWQSGSYISMGDAITPVNTTTTTSPVTTTTTAAPPAINADFSGTPTWGYLPLAVQFTDASTGPVDQWSWNFGDGNVSSLQNPQYTYPGAGNYTVSLTVTNITYGISSTATKVNYTNVQSFAEFVSNESVFVYGTKLSFKGDTITGEDATVIVTGSLDSADLNMNSAIAVNTIYVNGDVNLGSGSVSLGYPGKVGNTYVNGNLNIPSGNHMIYGDVKVAGSANLAGANVRDNMTVNGDVNLGWSTVLGTNTQVIYTGTLTTPAWYSDTETLSKCIHQSSVPGFTIPDLPIPSAKAASWYTGKGYTNTVPLSTTNPKIYSDSSYTYTVSGTVSNVIVVAANGDITLSGGGSHVSGILFAPNGRVTFSGDSFEGVIIARDGLFVPSGGTDITFMDLDDYVADPADYPF